MEHHELIDALEREGMAICDLTITDIDVPTCPGWSLPDLIHHIGWVHRWQEAQLRAADPNRLESIDHESEIPLDELTDWYEDGLRSLLATLRATPADHPVPSWFGPRTATFWARRAAHETAVHRWDAESAATNPHPLDPRQAADALDELLEVIAPRRYDPTTGVDGTATIHLHATDGDGEWLITMDSSGLTFTHAHQKGDVAARGTASDLMLMMAGRVPPARLELHGDAAALDAWFRAVRL